MGLIQAYIFKIRMAWIFLSATGPGPWTLERPTLVHRVFRTTPQYTWKKSKEREGNKQRVIFNWNQQLYLHQLSWSSLSLCNGSSIFRFSFIPRDRNRHSRPEKAHSQRRNLLANPFQRRWSARHAPHLSLSLSFSPYLYHSLLSNFVISTLFQFITVATSTVGRFWIQVEI